MLHTTKGDLIAAVSHATDIYIVFNDPAIPLWGVPRKVVSRNAPQKWIFGKRLHGPQWAPEFYA